MPKMGSRLWIYVLAAALGLAAILAGCSEPATPSVPDVTISPTSVTLGIGGTQKLTANVAVTWSSSDTAIATVAADGTVTGVAVGKTTITATSTVDTSKADTVEVTVTPVTPPPVIANLTATIAMESTVDLAWTASDATDFDVYAVLNSDSNDQQFVVAVQLDEGADFIREVRFHIEPGALFD
ncbi:MAG: Ig-like domain-containing protein, partial [Deinococcales bacterium]